MVLLLTFLLACGGASPEEKALAALEADGMTDIELTGDLGVFEFRATKDTDMCAGTITVSPGDDDPTIDKFCSPAWGPEELKLPVRVSRQGRERAHACDTGSQKDCALLGTDYRDGTNGIPGDKDNAVRLFDGACTGGSYHGCTYLAEVYEKGELVDQDQDKAIELYMKSCELGSDVSCKRIGKEPAGEESSGDGSGSEATQ